MTERRSEVQLARQGGTAERGGGMTVTLSRLAVGLPAQTEAVDDILARGGWSATEQRLFGRVYHLAQSPTLSPDERMEDLLISVGRSALGSRRPALVLYGHTLLMQEFAFRGGFADRFRRALDLDGVPLYGLSHVACTSVLRAVELARRFLARLGAGPDESVLIVGGDQASILEPARILPRQSVCGDAAVAFVVRGDRGRYRYLGGAADRDARFHRGLRMTPADLRLYASTCYDHALESLAGAVASAGLGLADIDWVMPQLSNAMFWRRFSELSGIPRERFCLDLLPERGHLFGTDALMALEHADRTGLLSVGQRCALISLGQGAYFQTVVVEVVAE
jgi:3-oxoacyl-[acyl-carrier-protein] synthase-3